LTPFSSRSSFFPSLASFFFPSFLGTTTALTCGSARQGGCETRHYWGTRGQWARASTQVLKHPNLYQNIPPTEYFVLEHPYWLTILSWNIPTDRRFCTDISLLPESLVLEYSYWLNVLYWNIPTDRIFCTGISLLTKSLVLEHPYWLTFLHWNIPTDWMFCTGISLLTEYLVLEYPYWPNV
jgi:hypothetical protein